MKILFLTIGDVNVASARARVYGYVPFLSEKKIEHKILSFTSKAKQGRVINLKKDGVLAFIGECFYKIRVIIELIISAKKYDIVFVQKVILPKIAWNALRTRNKKIIFDFDDAIFLYREIAYLLNGADGVIVSSGYLKDFASKHNKRVYELISPVNTDDKMRIPQERKGNIALGWIGSPGTSGYLENLKGVFKELKARFKDLRIEFMGAQENGHLADPDIKIRPWSPNNEKEFLDNIDIGIMPLENNEWSRSKAGYKLLVYMSHGISCVASPVGINSEIIEDGVNGYLADTPSEWVEKISRLISDNALRYKLGEMGRLSAENNYSYRVCNLRMLGILEDIKGAKI